jgi:hypothetical protein
MPRNEMILTGMTFGVALLFCAAPGMATTIDFDDIPGSGVRSFLGDRYESLGVLISSDPGAGTFAFGPASDTNTPPTFVYGSSTAGGTANASLIIDFVLPGTAIPAVTDLVSFFAYDAEGGIGSLWTAAIYDLGLNLLDTFSSMTNDEILVSFSMPGIHRLVFTPSADLEGIDTLSFNEPAGVPEPGTLALLAVGLLTLGLRRRGSAS